ncbi:TetR/AcrR family transcriptional regulator [Subtercola lobariae]|uniref:TetR/AcrR family transcriptional regulator n=1 Tax=Subtercola lobariae TaxID=1588641 RepID=UPI00166C6B09|nr:TetR/AcrR family transcriptional regulator [Subtercola lobariae]
MQAAREVFARKGLSATLEDIAAQAGVGVGTVYRNFASKREIVETLYDEAIESALADVQDALAIEDPWQAIVAFFEVTAANQARDRGLGETLHGPGHGPGAAGPSQLAAATLVATLQPLFERAAAAGVIRDGVTATDIWPIFTMLNSVYGLSEANPDLWRRYLTLLLDGLRATDRGALPVPPLDVAAFTAAVSRADSGTG